MRRGVRSQTRGQTCAAGLDFHDEGDQSILTLLLVEPVRNGATEVDPLIVVAIETIDLGSPMIPVEIIHVFEIFASVSRQTSDGNKATFKKGLGLEIHRRVRYDGFFYHGRVYVQPGSVQTRESDPVILLEAHAIRPSVSALRRKNH